MLKRSLGKVGLFFNVATDKNNFQSYTQLPTLKQNTAEKSSLE